MYEYLKGYVTAIYSDSLVLDVNGVGYLIYIANSYRFTDQIDRGLVTIYVYQSISQDAVRLYGFADQEEKILFLQLISVSGIGPKSAISILSLGDQNGLVQAIEASDSQFLTKFPGVGKKTAQQIILDLQGKLPQLLPTLASEPLGQEVNGSMTEASLEEELRQALLNLGFSQRDVNRVVKQIDYTQVSGTAEAIKLALKCITSS
ncbi:Holliday junction ATP-dependent DNA helicase RuvA [Aerococcus urinaehominis]|uniref:Holliday junction branch migration complex subunit RuvA n=1 Tax=Aerococcus urinaehominis TaxID=128944 RepID=A0A0X8FMB2_9LACT|nr:Holliday junction branch migration protein RuvA [Aerococcus urinaehominis]AMB99694.1 Holliday junction ATP-dependent DNA helicase RuvA [Aerococcus urinaehominis]SDL90833.1 Holliday junction DNA helicase subunit RuvA [Aerococcus urinaehominis]